jgi:hypothetical protein
LKLGKEAKDQPQQCGGAYAQQTHFVDEHEDKTHDGKFQCVGKRNLGADIPLPNLFEQPQFFY